MKKDNNYICLSYESIDLLKKDELYFLSINTIKTVDDDDYRRYFFSDIQWELQRSIIYDIEGRINRYYRSVTSSNNRRYRLAKTYGLFSPEDIDLIYEAQEGLCYYTKAPLSQHPKNYSIDHIVPISNDGSNWPINLVLAEQSINRKKHAKSKRKFLKIIENTISKDDFCELISWHKIVDKKRRSIDRQRKKIIKNKIIQTERKLNDEYAYDVSYKLEYGQVVLCAEWPMHSINFPPGFITSPKLTDTDYLISLLNKLNE